MNEDVTERLVCPYGHMAKPDSDYEEGDKCPNYFYCSCRDHEFDKVKIPKKKIELKEKCRAIRYTEPEEEGLEYTPQEHACQILTYYTLSPIGTHPGERERMAEAYRALTELYAITRSQPYFDLVIEFIENPWSVCLECGKVCKNNKGRKIHKSKEHRGSFL